MAAVTVNTIRHSVEGNQRVLYLNIDVASDADTFDTKLHVVRSISATSVTNNAIGALVSTSSNQERIAFQTGGTENGVLVRIAGV